MPQQAAGQWMPQILSEHAAISSSDSDANRPYLPDFSYAGYRWGEEPLPTAGGEVIDVTRYGAVPDDGRDDTEAVLQALEAAHATDGPVVVRFPEGRLILRQILTIERSNLVLQGAGGKPSGTELYFPEPMKEMDLPGRYQLPVGANGHSPYSWSGGVIWTKKPEAPEEQFITDVISGERGQHHFTVEEAPADLEPGDIVRISWYNRGGNNSSLLKHVYGTTGVPFGRRLYEDPDRSIVTQEVTVVKVEGTEVTIKEPLLHNLREIWTPTLHGISFLEEVGIEHLRISFPDKRYAGHHEEEGYNGLFLTDLMHSWVRDVTVVNADSGLLSNTCKNVTITDISVLGRGGHYTIHLGPVYGVLVKDFNLKAPALHNPSFNTHSRYSVYTEGSVYAPRFDQHNGVNHQNLFDNIFITHFRTPGRFFANGGSGYWKPTAGAFNTFWNVRIMDPDGETELGEVQAAPHARLIGLHGERPVSFDYGPEAYIEGENRPGIGAPSLYEYQRKQRTCAGIAPSIAVSSPANGAALEEGEEVTIEASLLGGEEDVRRVVFYVNGNRIGQDTDGSDGWSYTWASETPGNFRIAAVAEDGAADKVVNCQRDAVEIWVGPPEEFVLGANYPNPATHRTTIPYTLRQEGHVRLRIYDVLGRRVATLVDGAQEAGQKEVHYDTGRLSSGMYFYQLIVDSSAKVRKMLVAR